jgi:hypothetical protein
MGGWETALTLFLVVVGAAYSLFVYSGVQRDDDDQHRNAGNPQP